MPGHIQYEGVGFRYNQRGRYSDWVLKDLNLEIPPGEFHVLLGPSGCGKTTVLNLLAGFEEPAAGMVRVDGDVVVQPGVDRVVIFQGDDSLYPWLTALENVEFGLRVAGMAGNARRERALHFLALVGLEGEDGKYPRELSGGMKQRVQLARALAAHSPILLMDEPFGALDAQTRGSLQIEVVEIWQVTGCSILFVTHDIAEAILLADRISVMTPGPGARIKMTTGVPLPRPRSLTDPDFAEIYARVSGLLTDRAPRGRRGAAAAQG